MTTSPSWRALACLGAFTALSASAFAAKIYTTGSQADVVAPTVPGLCLAGGGSDDAWAGGWRFMLERTGGGDVVVIRADGQRGGYESFIYNDDGHNDFPAVDSVTTIVLEGRKDAERADVLALVRQAEMVFFAGGDQWDYIRWIEGTPLAAEVESAANDRGVPVGGTSAGMALLAGIDYTGRYGSPNPNKDLVDSNDVMRDPTGRFVDLTRSVITPRIMQGVITDTHFSERKRQGRLVGFMARATWNWPDVSAQQIKAIAADEDTATCIDEHGFATAFGWGEVFVLQGDRDIERLREGRSLNWWGQAQAVKAFVMKGNRDGRGLFDLNTWTGLDGQPERWWVDGRRTEEPVFGRSRSASKVAP